MRKEKHRGLGEAFEPYYRPDREGEATVKAVQLIQEIAQALEGKITSEESYRDGMYGLSFDFSESAFSDTAESLTICVPAGGNAEVYEWRIALMYYVPESVVYGRDETTVIFWSGQAVPYIDSESKFRCNGDKRVQGNVSKILNNQEVGSFVTDEELQDILTDLEYLRDNAGSIKKQSEPVSS